MDQPNPITTVAKPRRRYQYRLKSLFGLPVIVGLLLMLYLYWDDWRKQRPPFQNNVAEYQAAHKAFFNDLAAGRLDHAYESSSARFKQRMSRSEFDTKIADFSAAWHGPESEEASLESSFDPSKERLHENRYEYGVAAKGPKKNVIELTVLLVIDDSFFCRKPPSPRVDEIQIREFDEANWTPFSLP